MKPLILLSGALLLSAPLLAQTPPVTAAKADLSAAQKTWADVREQTRELDALVEGGKLSEVHDAALGLRDTVRELRFGWEALAPAQQASADANIRKIDALLDSLHEHADHNNPRGVAQDQRTLHVLLDQIAASFGANTLQKIGPVVATSSVKDPFCRMTVDPATAAASAVYGGQTYYFCAAPEAEAFKKNPAPYVALYDEIAFGKPKQFGVNVWSPGPIVAGREAPLVFAVREEGVTEPTRDFQLVHEKLFHLIAVSDDLSWFGHVHPMQGADGRFYLKQTFPRDGRYFLYSDFTPQSGSNIVAHSQVRVGSGVTRAPQQLVPDATLSKIVDGVQVDLKLSSPLQAGKQALLSYTLSQDGAPVENMTPYLAAMGHMMAISQGGQHAVHTHSVSAGSDPRTGLNVSSDMATAKGPTQSFKLELPTGGLYRVWAQFGVNGRILTVPFTFQVQENPNMKPTKVLAATAAASALALGGAQMAQTAPTKPAPKPAPAKAKVAPQKVTITLPEGYKTGAATVKAGTPVALTFFLKSDAGCGNTIALPAAKWQKTLEVGEKATVTYTPTKSGPLSFQCGMAHMKGTVVVK